MDHIIPNRPFHYDMLKMTFLFSSRTNIVSKALRRNFVDYQIQASRKSRKLHRSGSFKLKLFSSIDIFCFQIEKSGRVSFLKASKILFFEIGFEVCVDTQSRCHSNSLVRIHVRFDFDILWTWILFILFRVNRFFPNGPYSPRFT